MDRLHCDPLGPHSTPATVEYVARDHAISTALQHGGILRREAQCADALADDGAFLRHFMSLPVEVPAPGFRTAAGVLAGRTARHFDVGQITHAGRRGRHSTCGRLPEPGTQRPIRLQCRHALETPPRPETETRRTR
jgi:hypothetical protein